MRTVNHLIVVFVLALWATAAYGTVWDAKADWSDATNPNGVWSYRDASTSNLLLATSAGVGGSPGGWSLDGTANTAPNLFNDTWGCSTLMLPEEFGGHGQWKVRWVSPITGRIKITARMAQLFPGGTRRMKAYLTLQGNPVVEAKMPEDASGNSLGVHADGNPASCTGDRNSAMVTFGPIVRNVAANDVLDYSALACSAAEGGDGVPTFVIAYLKIETTTDPIGNNVYHVAKTGSDSNPGTDTQPFLTIQKAATVMNAGDTCYVHAGVYRETVAPYGFGIAGYPISFIAYGTDAVTVSGADPVTGWSVYSGNIYRASTAATLNQLFVDGKMMIEARWPNIGVVDVLDGARATADTGTTDNGTTATLIDADLTQANGFWNGATIHITSGYEWVEWARTIATYTLSTHTLTFPSTPNDPAYAVRKANHYYLTGILGALDAAGEFFLDDPADYVYLWTPAGDSPASHQVETKFRTYAFDCSSHSYITITGFNIFAATINLANATYCTVDDCYLKYLSHFNTSQGWGNWYETGTGIVVTGNYNTIKNSHLAYSAGNGIYLGGTYNTVQDNVIHDVDYAAVDCGAIFTNGSHHTITRNTLYRGGRSLLLLRQTDYSSATYNHIYKAGYLTSDLGCLYTFNTNGQWSSVAYNWVHDNIAVSTNFPNGTLTPGGTGIYMDNGCSNWYIHHNVAWSNNNCGFGINVPASYEYFYNNTSYGNPIWGFYFNYPNGSVTNCRMWNCASQNPNQISNTGINRKTNYTQTTGSLYQFVNPAGGDFRLQSTSPCKNTGTVISPFTDGYIGTKPDIGAYEYGGANWYPGPQRTLWSWDFNVDNDLEGWTPHSNNNIINVTVSGGQLHGDIVSWDPVLMLYPAAYVKASCRYLHISMKNGTPADHGEFHWASWTGSSPSVPISFSIVPNDTIYREYVVDLGVYSQWVDAMSYIRLDPVAATGSLTGHVDIDYIELTQ